MAQKRDGYDLGDKRYDVTNQERFEGPDRRPTLRLLSIGIFAFAILLGLLLDSRAYGVAASSLGNPGRAYEARTTFAGDHTAVHTVHWVWERARDLRDWWTNWLVDEEDKKKIVRVPLGTNIPPPRGGFWALAGPFSMLVLFILLFHVWITPRVVNRADFYKVWTHSIVVRAALGAVDIAFFASLGTLSVYFFM